MIIAIRVDKNILVDQVGFTPRSDQVLTTTFYIERDNNEMQKNRSSIPLLTTRYGGNYSMH